MKLTVVIVFLVSTLISCKKSEDRTCYKSLGEKATKIVLLDDFTKMKLKSKMKFVLVQDDSNYLKIVGGKNVINFIKHYYSEEGYLEIYNENKCNFLRNLKEIITVEIHFKTINELFYEGSETLICPDTIQLSFLHFVVLDACGTFNLKIKADYLNGNVSHGMGDYNIEGEVINSTMSIRSNGYCNIEKLKVEQNLGLINESEGNMYVNANNNNISGYISGGGNIYYKGIPLTLEIKLFGTGKFIAN